MIRYSAEQLRQRAFDRAAWVLKHYWEEQQDDEKKEARVHTRLFDPLVPYCHIEIGKSKNGGGHKEHLIPCVMLRDHAFKMYWDNRSEADVAKMLSKFLRIANITSAEARHLDHVLGLKTKMPDGWDFETGSVMARLEVAGIELVLKSSP
jgi:hypothetical protein